VVEGQIAGGLTQAIGTVLLEEAGYDARGNPLAVTYKDYLLPAICDVPDFEFLHACTPSKSEGGFRGVGEGGAIIGPPTLFNAIADALSPFGAPPIDLPLTPAKILEVIEGRPIAGKTAEAAAATPAPVRSEESEPAQCLDPRAPSVPHAAAAPAMIDGSWKMVLATPMGPQEMVGRFSTEGSVLKGVLESAEGAMDFVGTVTGNQLKWEMKVRKPMPITLKYDLSVEGNTISGKAKLGMFGTAKVSGVRM
jgi:carbon-monoxide dehydrogenase large subunit